MIGYEFEIFLHDRAANHPITSDKYLLFHEKLALDGWTNVIDPVTKGVSASNKGGISIKTDDPIYIMELNMPPSGTIEEGDRQMKELITYLKAILGPMGIDMLGIGVYPLAVPDKFEFRTYDSWGRHIIPMRYYFNEGIMHKLCSNQFWLDVPKERFVERLNAFNMINGVCIALLGNSAIQDGKPSGFIEKRPILWQEFSKTPWPIHLQVIGMPATKYSSVHDYISRWLAPPVYYAFHEGMSFFVEDMKMNGVDFLNSGSVEIIKVDTTRKTIKPTLKELWYFQKNVFFEGRGRITFRKGAKIEDFRKAYAAKDDAGLLACIEKAFVECRFISGQNQREFSIGAAMLLGLNENFEKVNTMLSKHDYAYWQSLRENAMRKGLDFEIEGTHITKIVREFLEAAREGLQKRGKGEEKFLEVALPLLEKKENPGQRKLRLLKEGGIGKVMEDCLL